MTKLTNFGINKIRNSKGDSTVEVVIYAGNKSGKASAPGGTSVGRHEVPAFNKNIDYSIKIAKRVLQSLKGFDIQDQVSIDAFLKKNLGKIGGAVSTATSIAVARTAANSEGKELFEYLHKHGSFGLPIPFGKIIGGGRHAKTITNFQEYLSLPFGFSTFRKAQRANEKAHNYVGRHIKQGKLDYEGGWYSNLTDPEAFNLATHALLHSSRITALGIDVASSSFYKGGKYHYGHGAISREEHLGVMREFAERFPTHYLEDPFHEEDFGSHAQLTKEFKHLMIVGDDLFTTNANRLRQGIKLKACNSIIIKPNQVGTLSDCLETVSLAQRKGYQTIISHRSGETMDNAIAHLAVAWNIPFIKIGIVGKEREAKTKELVRIEKLIWTRYSR